MQRIRLRFDYILLFTFLTIFGLFLVGQCFAQSEGGTHNYAPEPASVALISSTGLLGFLVRFARRRFEEFKRGFDVVVSATGLVVCAPLIVLGAIIIKIVSPGPIFFLQERVGRRGRVFNIFKLRTMEVDAERHTGPVWAQEDDPRLIKFGKLIRKAHIDELPQLINVLRGEMSIVGPRPERPVFVKELRKEIPDYVKRLRVKPGITGLAQVWHKYDETLQDVKKKIKYDLLYIRKMCPLVDFRILLRTIFVVARGEGAR